MFKKVLLTSIVCSLFLNVAHSVNLQDVNSHQVKFVKMDDNIKLEVFDWGGKGQPLVFLAGLSLNAHTFKYIANEFTDSNRVVGITRVGHGNSDTRKSNFSLQRLSQDIINVLDAMNIDGAIFVGHSVAGGS